jgi:hypothetical protein
VAFSTPKDSSWEKRVLELIRALALSADLSEELNPYVREKYAELWRAAQTRDSDQP